MFHNPLGNVQDFFDNVHKVLSQVMNRRRMGSYRMNSLNHNNEVSMSTYRDGDNYDLIHHHTLLSVLEA